MSCKARFQRSKGFPDLLLENALCTTELSFKLQELRCQALGTLGLLTALSIRLQSLACSFYQSSSPSFSALKYGLGDVSVSLQDMTETFTTSNEASEKPSKVCFVTIGATASFDKLLKAVLDNSLLEALHKAEYTDLLIQYGKEKGKAIYDSFVSREQDRVKWTCGINIAGFDFDTNGLAEQMRKAKGDPGNGSKEGLIISHAGY